MNSAYYLNLYITPTAHKDHIFRFPWVAFIYRFDCVLLMLVFNWLMTYDTLVSILSYYICHYSKNTLFSLIIVLRFLGLSDKPYRIHFICFGKIIGKECITSYVVLTCLMLIRAGAIWEANDRCASHSVIKLSLRQKRNEYIRKRNFKDTKGVIRSRKSKKNRQYTGEKKKDERTCNDIYKEI
jgi:hypothetical protein